MIHRLLREGDPAFCEEFLTFTQRVRILQLSNFKDDSSPIGLYFFNLNLTWCFIWIVNILPYFLLIYCLYILELYLAWDCSLCVRTYGLFLEEKTRMLQGLEVWHWSWAFIKASSRTWKGLDSDMLIHYFYFILLPLYQSYAVLSIICSYITCLWYFSM